MVHMDLESMLCRVKWGFLILLGYSVEGGGLIMVLHISGSHLGRCSRFCVFGCFTFRNAVWIRMMVRSENMCVSSSEIRIFIHTHWSVSMSTSTELTNEFLATTMTSAKCTTHPCITNSTWRSTFA